MKFSCFFVDIPQRRVLSALVNGMLKDEFVVIYYCFARCLFDDAKAKFSTNDRL